MSQTILLRRSAVPGKVPTPAQLESGELAVNTFDGKMYLKTDNGTPAVKEIGGDPFPSQAGHEGMFLKTDGTDAYWSETGGTATQVTQPGHGFTVGEVLRHNGTQYVRASASSENTADVIGIVTSVESTNSFELTTSGIVSFPASTVFTPGQPYFLSPTTAGSLTLTEPTTTAHISKPLFIALTTNSGLFYNWRGIEITPEVEIDSMLPNQAGNNGNVLMSDGTSAGWKSVAEATASKTVVAANTFSVGQIVRANTSGGFVLAQANNLVNSQVYGIISGASPTQYTITTAGNVYGMVGLTTGVTYYLSDTTPGALTGVEPTTASSISKPLFIATSATDGVFYNQRGLASPVASATSAQLLPSQSGQNLNFLTTNGVSASWASVPTTAAAIVSTIGATFVQNATNATNAGNANTLDNIDSSGFWQIGGNQNVDIASNTASAGYQNAAIEVREVNHGGAFDGNIMYAPRVSFYWSGRAAAQIGMEASGNVAILDGAGTAYSNLVCNTMTGLATSANYADLAEKYTADAQYEPGTVLAIGGEFELTLSTTDCDPKVVGVVSTNPAYLMNDKCEGEFVVSLALTGRAPCRVTGIVSKGDMLVSNGDGTARRMSDEYATVGTVIGKALESFTGETGVIEVLIGKH